VDKMQLANGEFAAVKRMPTKWVRTGPQEFLQKYPTASERPWMDFSIVKLLNARKFTYVCELVGIFRDDVNTFVVTTYATEGDMFSWCDREPRPGKDREDMMRPFVREIFEAIWWIHLCGIAHRDLSLENILLTKKADGELQIKLIDFGNATLMRWCTKEVRGKQSYQAPEMHKEGEYDTFCSDAFSLGVIVFAMAVQDYPWIATKPNTCQMCEYVRKNGFCKLLERRKLRKGDGERLIDVLSPNLTGLLDGLLKMEPEERSGLGEKFTIIKDGDPLERISVWDDPWLEMLP